MDKIKKWLPLGAAIAGGLALILFIVCPALVFDFMGVKEADANVSGIMAIFGDKEKEYKASFWCILAVILLVVAVVCSILSYVKPENKLFARIAAACFAVAAIFLFSTKGFSLTANDAKEAADMYKLGAGPIIAGILSILGAGAVVCPVVLNK